jgi:hypothetical protein
MQQIIITLVALLGMIVPIAAGRMIKLFGRFVPLMPMAGRVGRPVAVVAIAAQAEGTYALSEAAGLPGARALHLRMQRLRRAFRAAA